MNKILEVIGRESTDIEKEAAIAAHSHFLSSRRWEKTNLALGIPSTALAGIAGLTILAEKFPPIVTGIVAILAAFLSGASTVLSPGDRATSHRTANTTFNAIRREASLLRDVDAQLVKDGDEDTAKQLADKLRELTAKITETDQNSPLISASSKEKAEAKFNDQFAPPNLLQKTFPTIVNDKTN